MKITRNQTVRQDWDKVKSWNYRIENDYSKMSVVYAELNGEHGEVVSRDFERIYYILDGKGEFQINGVTTDVAKDDVITIAPNSIYNYRPKNKCKLKILLLMELWDN